MRGGEGGRLFFIVNCGASVEDRFSLGCDSVSLWKATVSSAGLLYSKDPTCVAPHDVRDTLSNIPAGGTVPRIVRMGGCIYIRDVTQYEYIYL